MYAYIYVYMCVYTYTFMYIDRVRGLGSRVQSIGVLRTSHV